MYHTNICQHMSSLTAYTMIVPKVHTAKEGKHHGKQKYEEIIRAFQV